MHTHINGIKEEIKRVQKADMLMSMNLCAEITLFKTNNMCTEEKNTSEESE